MMSSRERTGKGEKKGRGKSGSGGLRKKRARKRTVRSEPFRTPLQQNVQKLIYELGKRQIELEMQNEKLRNAEEARRLNEERFRLAVCAAHAMIYDIDAKSGRVLAVSGMKDLTGYVPEEAPPAQEWWGSLIHPDDAGRAIEQFRDFLACGRNAVFQYRLRHKDGRYVFVEDTATVVRDGAGKPVRMVGGVVDVTARSRTEEELRQAREIAEQRARDARQAEMALADALRTARRRAAEAKEAHAALQKTEEELRLHRDRLGELVLKRTAQLEKTVEMLEKEIADRRRAEEELFRSRERLRNLSAHVEAVREGERTSVAREIHDELGQALTALKMEVSWLRSKLPAGDGPLRERAGETVQLIDGAIQAVKKISSELRPSVLDNLGLEAAVEWASKEFERRMGISCDLTLPPEPLSLDRNRSTVIYRVLQESLTNVARHAGATMVAVSLEKRDGEIRLSVRDNGRGVSKEEAEDPHAFGLIGMRERIEFLGGVFSIEGSKDRGTAVTAALPLGGESTGEEHGAA